MARSVFHLSPRVITTQTQSLGSLQGHLSLVCSRSEDGRSYLSQQSFRAPLQISKPYWTGEALLVNMVNPTAGLFSGDEIEISALVEPGARLLLTTPAASRAHAMPSGGARVRQKFQVMEGGWLEVLPELFIPQADCEYSQQTTVEIEPGGELFLAEAVAPGRVARGESYQFRDLRWALNLRHGGKLLARERARLTPDSPNTLSARRIFPNAYHAACFCVSPRAGEEHPAWGRIRDLHSATEWVGVSRLGDHGRVIRILAGDSVGLSRALKAARSLLEPLFPALAADSRKL